MRRVLSLLLLLAAFAAAGSMVKFSQTIPYSGKPIMLLFDSKTCPYCEKMKKELESDPILHREAVKFDIYRIPRDDYKSYTVLGNPTTTQNLQMLYKVKVTPYVVLLSSKGEKIWQLPGYVKPDVLAKIMAFVEGVDSGKYQKSEWKAYLRKAGVI